MSDAWRITGFSMGNTVIFVSYRTLPGQIDEALAAIGALIATVQAFIQSASAFLTGPPEITFWRQVSGT